MAKDEIVKAIILCAQKEGFRYLPHKHFFGEPIDLMFCPNINPTRIADLTISETYLLLTIVPLLNGDTASRLKRKFDHIVESARNSKTFFVYVIIAEQIGINHLNILNSKKHGNILVADIERKVIHSDLLSLQPISEELVTRVKRVLNNFMLRIETVEHNELTTRS